MGNVKYIAVKYTSADSYYLFLDDFIFEEVPSCLEPTNVAASNISATGATISWTAGGSETSWDLFYTNNPSTVPGSGTTPSVSGITSASKDLTGLDPASTYYVYVRAACGGSDKSGWSSVCTFNTDCNAMSLPYTNDFETGALTVCWTAINESPVYMSTSVSNYSPNNGTYHLELDRRTPTGTQIIVLPEVDASYALTDYEVSFYAMLSNKGNGSYTSANRTLTIGVMTDPTDPSTFVQVGEIVSPTDTYAQYAVSLSGYSGNGHYIAIKHDEATSGNNGYTFIDDLKVSTPPPTKIVASSTHAADEMTWAEFVGYVNGGYSYSGKTVTLQENITGVTAMAGSYETGKPFSGTFEGNGHSIAVNINNSGNSNTGDAYKGAALFRLISGATIQNLTVTGNVLSSAHHAAGLVGFCATGSTNIIVNCHVNTRVTNNTPGVGTGTNNYIGGIIGHNQDATTTIEGCVYDGTLTSTAFKGGMVGFSGNAAITISNSYFCGDYSTSANFSPVGCKAGNATVTYTVSNLYYSKDAGAFGDNSSYDATASGAMHAYSITPVSPVILTVNGNATDIYSVSGITAYTTGIKYNNVLYAGDGEDVELILSGSSIGEYAASYGTLSGTSNPYTLSMVGSDTEISAYNCAKPTDLQAFLTPGNGAVATLAWTSNGSATNWVLEYSTTSDFSVIVDSENVSGSPSHRLEGLTAETTYYARVKADCGDTDGQSAWSSTCEFTPTNEPTLTVDNGSATNSVVPIYGTWVDNKSYSQFIIPANDLSAMTCGTINKLTFYSNATDEIPFIDEKGNSK